MRIHVYSQELTGETEIVEKEGGFIGIRFIQRSGEWLHYTPIDDDRTAVTFWVADDGRTMDRHEFAQVLRNAAYQLDRN